MSAYFSKIRLFIFLIPLCFIVTACEAAPTEFQKSTVTIKTANGEAHDFNVELARTPAEQSQGLMYRTEMADDAGMLFVFKNEQPLAFWMRNTFIPLDMLFISRRGYIRHIHSNAKPQDDTHISSQGPAFAVLEINGGMAERLNIRPGDKIIAPYFENDLEE